MHLITITTQALKTPRFVPQFLGAEKLGRQCE